LIAPGKSLLIGLALIIGFSLYPPCAATGEEKPAAGKTSSIYVEVLDEVGEPVPGAGGLLWTVTQKRLTEHGSKTSKRGKHKGETGDDGSFRIGGLGPGEYDLVITAAGFAKESLTEIFIGNNEEKSIQFMLREEKTICGTVEDTDGRPVPDVTLNAYIDEEDPGRRHDHRAESDDEGKFELAHLKDSSYDINLSKKGYLYTTLRHVPAGTTGLRATIHRGGTITGTILTAEGKVPGEEVKISAEEERDDAGRGWWTLEVDENGRYTHERGPTGRVSIVAKTESMHSGEPVIVRITSGQIVDNVNLTLYPSARISGKVISASDDSPFKRTWVRAKAIDPELYVHRSDVTDLDGKYNIILPVPGEYLVEVSELATRERRKTSKRICLNPGEHRKNVDFILDSQRITIGGSVSTEDGKPVPGAEIGATTAGGGDHPFLLTTTDHHGRFQIIIDMLPKIIVSARDETHAWTAGKPIFPDKSTQEYEVNITLQKGVAIYGIVRDSDRAPISNTAISVLTKTGGYKPIAEVTTDETGYYNLRNVPCSKVRLIASREGFITKVRDLTCKSDGDEYGVDLTLRPGGKLSGTVKDSGGNPLAGASVVYTEKTGSSPYFVSCEHTQTDESGSFSFINLGENKIELTVSQPGYRKIEIRDIKPDRRAFSLIMQGKGE